MLRRPLHLRRLRHLPDGVQGRFDLIVSNPPYIAHGEIATLDAGSARLRSSGWRSTAATTGSTAYRAIAADARRLLAPGGRLIVELGAGQEPPVTRLVYQAPD